MFVAFFIANWGNCVDLTKVCSNLLFAVLFFKSWCYDKIIKHSKVIRYVENPFLDVFFSMHKSSNYTWTVGASSKRKVVSFRTEIQDLIDITLRACFRKLVWVYMRGWALLIVKAVLLRKSSLIFKKDRQQESDNSKNWLNYHEWKSQKNCSYKNIFLTKTRTSLNGVRSIKKPRIENRASARKKLELKTRGSAFFRLLWGILHRKPVQVPSKISIDFYSVTANLHVL